MDLDQQAFLADISATIEWIEEKGSIHFSNKGIASLAQHVADLGKFTVVEAFDIALKKHSDGELFGGKEGMMRYTWGILENWKS